MMTINERDEELAKIREEFESFRETVYIKPPMPARPGKAWD